MQASFDIDINDYMTTREIEDMVRDEVRYYISDKVKNTLRQVAISDIIYSTASKTALQLLEEQDVDLHQKIASKVIECVDGLERWNVFCDSKEYGKSNGQIVLDECVEEARPKIQQKVDDIIEYKLNADWLVDEVVDAFYSKLRDQLIVK